MTHGSKILLAAILVALPFTISAKTKIASLEKGMAGPRTPVLVLGSLHLSQLPDTFDKKKLEPVLERLARYKPDIITIERLSGESCDLLLRHPSIYPGVADNYCRDTDIAKKSTGLDVPAALAEAEKILLAWPANPSAAQRRHLIAVFAAANERASALTQWLQLPTSERHPGDGLDAPLITLMEKIADSNDESYQIGAVLAARLGLQRVYATDDHTSDSIQANASPAFEAAVQKIWASAPGTIREKAAAIEKTGDMLAVYRFYNQPDTLQSFIAPDFGAALKDNSPELYGRQYVGWWETRNLRMVANIRAAFANHPGERVLSIVGASHKPYFDTYLDQMHEVEIIDAEAVLQ